jgi:hypothetical protein
MSLNINHMNDTNRMSGYGRMLAKAGMVDYVDKPYVEPPHSLSG